MKFLVISPLLLTLATFFSIFLCHGAYVDVLQSCLLDHNVNEFYMYPRPENDPSVYYTLLNFSIQNLRFTGPTVPKPVSIILPTSKEELVHSVSCCRKGMFEIRVRCGGHSYEGSSYVSSGNGSPFVVIDMMRLDRVIVDLPSETAWVEGGATLGQTYYSIAEASNAHGFSAGSCPTVGVGGHIGGGGFGLLSRKYGLAADNVVDALLVDSGGALLDRPAMGEDVFWAIRGGGGGVWGVVYAWKIRLLEVPEIVTGFIVSRSGEGLVTKLVNKWQHVAPKLPDEYYLSAFVGAGLPGLEHLGISATFKGFFLGPKSQGVSILHEAFPELGIEERHCKEMSWIESVMYFSGLEYGTPLIALKDRLLQNKNYFKAKSDYVRKALSEQGLSSLIQGLTKEPKGYVILDPYGGEMERISSEAIAFPHRKGNLFTIQYLVEWKAKEDVRRGEYTEWIRGLYDNMGGHVSAQPRAAYVNYMDYDLGVMEDVVDLAMGGRGDDDDMVEMARVWGEKYFLGNYDRLVRVKTMIDPMNVFRNQQGIPPKTLATLAYSLR